jgi:endonuclease IV
MALKIGVKFYPESLRKAEIELVADRADFIEMMAVKGEDLRWLKDFSVPFAVHCMHSEWGMNPANGNKSSFNREALDFAIKTADMLGSGVIVVHPGYNENADCSLENAARFFGSVEDGRVLVENMPPKTKEIGGLEELCKTPEEMRALMERSGKGMCLDFGHAAASARFYGKDYLEFIRKFMALRPAYFHLSDTLVERGQDMHLHLGKGNMDLKAIKAMIPDGSMVCLETGWGAKAEKLIEDLEMMRKL